LTREAGAAGLAAVAAVAAVLGAPGQAQAAPCPSARALPEVSLTTRPGTVTYDSRLDRQQMQRLQGRTGASSRKRGWHAIGLTLTELQFRMNISVDTLAQPDGRHCATVGRVDARLGYDAITVHVDRRYRRGSCQYISVIEHEDAHVAVFRDVLAVYAPKVERRLVAAASRVKPVSARSADAAATKIQKTLQREMEPLFDEMNKLIDRRNDRIDTADNYRREQAKCSSW